MPVALCTAIIRPLRLRDRRGVYSPRRLLEIAVRQRMPYNLAARGVRNVEGLARDGILRPLSPINSVVTDPASIKFLAFHRHSGAGTRPARSTFVSSRGTALMPRMPLAAC